MSTKDVAQRFTDSVHQVIVGQDETIRLAFMALALRGHILIEGVPERQRFSRGPSRLTAALQRSHSRRPDAEPLWGRGIFGSRELLPDTTWTTSRRRARG